MLHHLHMYELHMKEPIFLLVTEISLFCSLPRQHDLKEGWKIGMVRRTASIKPSVHLMFSFTIICEQNPETLKLLWDKKSHEWLHTWRWWFLSWLLRPLSYPSQLFTPSHSVYEKWDISKQSKQVKREHTEALSMSDLSNVGTFSSEGSESNVRMRML